MGSPPYLRVNGIEIDHIQIRHKIVAGAPTKEKEIVIDDPVLGLFAIDETVTLETRRDRRKKWEIISLQDFLAMVGTNEATTG